MNFPTNFTEYFVMLIGSWPWLLVCLVLLLLGTLNKNFRKQHYLWTFLVALPIIAIICAAKIIGMFLAFALTMIPIMFLVLRHTGVYVRERPKKAERVKNA